MQDPRTVTYYNIGLVEFYHCLFDESQLDEYGIDKESFAKIRAHWEDLNPDNSRAFMMKRMITQRKFQLDFYQLLYFTAEKEIEFCRDLGEAPEFKSFDRYGIDYDENDPLAKLQERIKYEERQIKKQTKTLKKIVEEGTKGSPETKADDFSLDDIMMIIASLESFTHIGDYFQLKLYRYEALTRTIKQHGESKGVN